MSYHRGDSRKRALLLVACFVGLASAGCGDIDSGRLVDYLDELEFDVPLETAAYVSLGRFDIPIAASRTSENGSKYVQAIAEQGLVWMRLQFELTAETTPPHEQAVLEAAEKHRGALNDAVLTIVRTSTVDELADPRLAAINARLSEVTRPLLGEDLVRQLVLNDPSTAEAKASSNRGGHGGQGDAGHGEAEHGEEVHGDAKHDDAKHGDEARGDEGHDDAAHGEEANGHR